MIHLQVQFTSPAHGWNPIARLIQAVQSTSYSHVLVKWIDPITRIENRFEANGHGARLIGPEAAKNRYLVHRVFDLELSLTQYNHLQAFAQFLAGIKYGRAQLIGMGLARWFGWRKNPFSDGQNTQVCSELIGHLIQTVFHVNLGLDLEMAGPKELCDWLDENLELLKEEHSG